MTLPLHIHSVTHGQLVFFYDIRSMRLHEIEEFLRSSQVIALQRSIDERAYIALGGDGLFVSIAKIAHMDRVPLLGINFGHRGYLLQHRELFSQESYQFDRCEYPILHAEVTIGDSHMEGYAYNEVYVSRAGDASTISLAISHRGEMVHDPYIGDGVIISTPAGSTGWGAGYGGRILPHTAHENTLTPVGADRSLYTPMTLPDKGRIRIQNHTNRINPIDILLDNRRILSMESRAFELVIERDIHPVTILVVSHDSRVANSEERVS